MSVSVDVCVCVCVFGFGIRVSVSWGSVIPWAVADLDQVFLLFWKIIAQLGTSFHMAQGDRGWFSFVSGDNKDFPFFFSFLASQ